MATVGVIAHREYAGGRKSDPVYSMAWRRARVAAFTPPAPAAREDDDMTPEQARMLETVHRELTVRLPNRMGLRDDRGEVGTDTLYGTALWAHHDAYYAMRAARETLAEVQALRQETAALREALQAAQTPPEGQDG